MKISLFYGIVIIGIWVVYAACTKGDARASGSQVLSGTGLPAARLGTAGDYYLDKSKGVLFGPKTADGWGEATSLAGQKGVAGSREGTVVAAHTADKKPGYH